MENLPSQQANEKTNGWGHKLSVFISFILILQFSIFAIVAISEIAARESVLSVFTGRIATLKSEFVERNRTRTRIETSISAESAPTTKYQSDKTYNDSYERDKLLAKIGSYEEVKRSLIFLIAQGSVDPSFSLNTILTIESNNFRLVVPDKKTEEAIERYRYEQFPKFMIAAYQPFLLLSSDQLLAIAIMACAAIGALIAALRGNGLMTLRALALGVATGFVVYLAIKGGKHVFLLQMQTEVVAFNPYGSAFAGLLAGMFTEKAYQILTTIVDDFADRLRAVSAGKKSGD